MKKLGIKSLLFCLLWIVTHICFSDSTGVPLPPTGSFFYPGTSAASPSIVSNEGYPTTQCPTPPVCPDINGNTPGNQPQNCPDSCVVTRTVNVVSGTSNPPLILSTTDAVCPAGYAAVNTFNAGPEIVSKGTNPISPVDQNTYNTLIQYFGATCGPNGTDVSSSFKCTGSLETDAGGIDNIVRENQVPNSAGGSGNMVMITGFEESCWGTIWCSLVRGRQLFTSNPITQICSKTATNGQYYHYQFLQCTPSTPILTYTNNMVPTSTVCSRIAIPTWLKIN